ncbi:hypothetical protein ACRAWF_19165 [Streptomyces sp. L7]
MQALAVKGKAWNSSWLSYQQFQGAGSLDFTLGTAPNKAWASDPSAAPPSDTTGGGRVLAATGPSSDGLVLQPGASGDGTLDLTNLGSTAVTVDWKATAPSGVTAGHVVRLADGTCDRQCRGEGQGHGGRERGNLPGHLRAHRPQHRYGTERGDPPRGRRQGRRAVAVRHQRGHLPRRHLLLGRIRQRRLGLLAERPVCGRCHQRFHRHRRRHLLHLADGDVRAAGQPGDGGPDHPDAVRRVRASLGLLGTATNAPTDGSGVSGTVTVTYTDGTTSQATIGFSDWTLNGGGSTPLPGDTTAVTTAYRNTGSGGRDNVKAYVFATKVPLDASKQVASITLPVTGSSGADHLFAYGFGQ